MREQRYNINDRRIGGPYLHYQQAWKGKRSMAQQLSQKGWIYVHASEFQYAEPKGWTLVNDDGSAELLHSWKLEVKGNCKASLLPKDKTYAAYFMVLLRKNSVFTTPTYLQITLPSEKQQVKSIELKDCPKEKTIRLQLGKEFNTNSLKEGDIEFSLYGNDQAGKRGLVVYGVLFAPVED